MEWWAHLWLNEGFATWVSYFATDVLYPEWRVWTQFLEVTAGGLRMLRKAIQDNCLSPEAKFGMLDATYALCEAGEESILSLLSLMDLYRNDLDYLVLSRLISVCYSVANILKDAIYDPWTHMNQFFIDLIISSSQKLGLEPVPGESHLNTMLRENVFMALATFVHKETHEELKKQFHIYISGKSTSVFPVDIRKE